MMRDVSICDFFVLNAFRLRLRPGFLTPEEADWMLSKLLAELPWSQKTNYRLGGYQQNQLQTYKGAKWGEQNSIVYNLE